MRLRMPRFFERPDGTLQDLLQTISFRPYVPVPLTFCPATDDPPPLQHDNDEEDSMDSDDLNPLMALLNQRVEANVDEEMLNIYVIAALSDIIGSPVRSRNVIRVDPKYNDLWDKHVLQLENCGLFSN